MGTTRRRRDSQADVESFRMRALECMGNHPHRRKRGLFNVLERLSQFAQRCRSKTFLSARLSRLSGSLALSPIKTQSQKGRGKRDGSTLEVSFFNIFDGLQHRIDPLVPNLRTNVRNHSFLCRSLELLVFRCRRGVDNHLLLFQVIDP